jgi:transcriptional regulator with XRE-family HTH domain
VAKRKNNQEKPIKKGRYRTVSEMVRDLSEDRELSESVRKRICERQIIDSLMGLRASLEMSQKDIADKMGCTQSRISKLENGKDDDLRIGDFHAYADALGLEMSIQLAKKSRTIVDEVKYHALVVNRLLARIAELAAGDETMAEGASEFICEAAYNLSRGIRDALRMMKKATARVTRFPKERPPLIHVESDDAEAEEGDPSDCEHASAS